MVPGTVEELLASLTGFTGDFWSYQARAQELVEEAKQLTDPEQVKFVLEVSKLLSNRQGLGHDLILKPAAAVLRKKLPFTPAQVLEMVQLGADPAYYFPFAQVLRLAESVPLTPELEAGLRQMRTARVIVNGQVSGHGQLVRRIDELLKGDQSGQAFEPAGSWSRAIASELTPALRAVLEAGKEIPGGEPSKKWRDAATVRIADIGREAFHSSALRWLALGPTPGETGVQTDTRESDYQRGLLWSLTCFPGAETCIAVARFAECCLRKIPSIGAVSQKSGNACVNVLAAMGGTDAVAQLGRLAMRIRYATAQRLVQEALEDAAKRQGIFKDELAEITVPDFGLGANGHRVERLGDCLADLDATGSVSYRNPDGKMLKSAPDGAKRNFAEGLKELKQAAKEIGAMRSAHRARIERLLMLQREIPITTWRAAYIDHPLIGELARRLIWQFPSGVSAIWSEGRMIDWAGAEVIPDGSTRLWHPLNSDVQTVLSWRCWLEDHEVRQPFKQAHREVYIVTDAERAAEFQSARFARHILKQHPFAALCEQRGWKFRLMGQWDSHNTPYLELPAFGLRADYDVDFPRDESVSGHMIYLFLQTGAVRFRDLESALPRRIESIPAVAFSEVMRDVDLFVGVASIGNDPLWGQRPQAPFADYWDNYSFGELSAAAQQRKELLERLLPKLPIRDRCRIEDRYLHVRGDRAEYRIHLGSGSVNIEPGSRYLCIVRGGAASSGAPSRVFLPFEEDTMLSLILSKAFLLAADRKITDQAILKQLP